MAINQVNQGIMPISPTPTYDAYRGFGAGLINKNAKAIASEDFMNDMKIAQYQNAFNASEAEKARSHEEMLANTSYQRAVSDLKKAGLNPILAYSNGGANTPAPVQATSAGVSRSSKSNKDGGDAINALLSLGSIVAGLFTGGAATAAKIAVANIGANAMTKSAQIKASSRVRSVSHERTKTGFTRYYN